jgi:predicted enzyme related to lactoylglutathione lyase
MPPTVDKARICDIPIPSSDPERDCNFHKQVFDWQNHDRDSGEIAFCDSTGDDSVAATIDPVRLNGGEIVEPIGTAPSEVTARFRDLSGNVLDPYQEPS